MLDVHGAPIALVHIASGLVDSLSNCLAAWGYLLLVVDQLFPWIIKVRHVLTCHRCHFLH